MLNVNRDREGKLLPTGTCWCGCGQGATEGNFWIPGHDRFAESAVIKLRYGSVAELLVEHGFGPGGRNTRTEMEEWRKSGGRTR